MSEEQKETIRQLGLASYSEVSHSRWGKEESDGKRAGITLNGNICSITEKKYTRGLITQGRFCPVTTDVSVPLSIIIIRLISQILGFTRAKAGKKVNGSGQRKNTVLTRKVGGSLGRGRIRPHCRVVSLASIGSTGQTGHLSIVQEPTSLELHVLGISETIETMQKGRYLYPHLGSPLYSPILCFALQSPII